MARRTSPAAPALAYSANPAEWTQDQWDAVIALRSRELLANPDDPSLIGHPEGNPVQVRPAWAPDPAAWETGVSRNADRWERGIRNPRANFKTAAAAANDTWKAATQEAIAQDRFARGVAAVNEDEAIETALAVGGGGWAAGATLRRGKYERNVGAVRNAMTSVVEQVRRMPKRTLAERVARATAMINGAAAAGMTSRRG